MRGVVPDPSRVLRPALHRLVDACERFQRTRGVLRLMAHVIHALYEAKDASPLIMPGELPLDQPKLRDELTKHLPENWTPIIDQDIDGQTSAPHQIEANNQTLHKMQAARRVTRTIFLGSAPGQETEIRRGVDIGRIKLGVALPRDALGNFEQRPQPAGGRVALPLRQR